MPRKEPLPEFETATSDKPRTRAVVVTMSDVPRSQVKWLWPARFAIGKLSLIAGDGGLGKSTVTLDIGARVSKGEPWPDGSGNAPLGDVVILSAEDDPADTIGPRLDAAGADATRIHVIKGAAVVEGDGEREYCITLADLWAIEETLDKFPNTKLLIIDPMAAYMGKADSHVDAEVRGLLAPLSALAAKRGVAVLIVAHLNKGTATKAIYRISGSQGTYNAVRSCWYVVGDDADEDKRMMLWGKNSNAKSPGGLAFRLEPAANEVARVQWIDGRIDIDIDDALGQRDTEQRATRDDANGFLIAELSDGPVKTEVLKKLARKAGIGWRTVEKAKADLGVISRRVVEPDGKAAWWWELPGHGTKPAQIVPVNPMRPCGVAEKPPAERDSGKAATPHGEVIDAGLELGDDPDGDLVDSWLEGKTDA